MALRDLVFYEPTLPVARSLVDLFIVDMKAPTKAFRLLCFHLIAHSKLAPLAPRFDDLVCELKALALNFKDPIKLNHFYVRVLFHLCIASAAYSELLIAALERILSKNPSSEKPKKKKQKKAKEARAAIQRAIDEAIDLLIELAPNSDLFGRLLSRRKVLIRIALLFPTLTVEYKQRFVRFWGFVSAVPVAILELVAPDTQLCQGPSTVALMSHSRERFAEPIARLLAGPPLPALSLLQLRLVEMEGPTDRVLASLVRSLPDRNWAAILALLNFLIKRPRVTLDRPAMDSLYGLVGGRNVLLAVNSLMCLSLLTEEFEWIATKIVQLLKDEPFTRRCAIVDLILDRWTAAIGHDEVRRLFWRILERLLEKFGDAIDTATFVALVACAAFGQAKTTCRAGPADRQLALPQRT
jgi:hypothetical protein